MERMFAGKKPQNKTSWFLKTSHLNRKRLKISLHQNQRRTGFQVVNNGSRPRVGHAVIGFPNFLKLFPSVAAFE